MDPARHPAGSVCWLDLGVADVEAVVAFYGELLGWAVAPPDPTGYRLAGLPGGLVAAFGPAEDPGDPYWTVYVGTADLEASVRAYVAAGGTVVVPPEAVGEVGASAVVRDPAGLPLSFWQPGTHLGTYGAGSGEPGTLAGVRLLGADPAPTAPFLATALGWRMRPDGTISHAGRPVAAWSPPVPGARRGWLVEFAVADVAAAAARALELGARPAAPALEATATLLDPAGARFTLTRASG